MAESRSDRPAPSGVPPEVVPDQTIDSTIDQMTEAAATLSHGVGADALPTSPTPDPLGLAAVDAEAAAQLDQQLAQTEQLLDATRQELGAAGDPPPSGSVGTGAPEIDADSPGGSGPAPAPAQPAATAISDDEVRNLVDAELEARAAIPPPRTSPGLRVASVAVAVLELLDRPFARLSGSVRHLIGWCAIATLAIALTAILLSYI
ncbi:MAG TPA: hypothetical protein VGM03_14145 [Phycisphaerae bacterium]|jgi:hypothetical protein